MRLVGYGLLVMCASCGRFGFDATTTDDAGGVADARMVGDAPLADATPRGLASAEGAALVPAPPSVELGVLEDDGNAIIFVEQVAKVLTAPVSVTFREPGAFDTGFDSVDPDPIPAGTRVTSFLLHADKVGSDNVLVDYNVIVTFLDPIVGIIVGDASLDASDGELAAPATVYPMDGRGLDNTEDTLTIGPNNLSLSVMLRVDRFMDQVRIVLVAP